MNKPSPSAATSIPLETLQAFGLAGKVQQELQRQRWLAALPEARDPVPEAELAQRVQAYLADPGASGSIGRSAMDRAGGSGPGPWAGALPLALGGELFG